MRFQKLIFCVLLIFTLVTVMFLPVSINASIYQCENALGECIFQDVPCNLSLYPKETLLNLPVAIRESEKEIVKAKKESEKAIREAEKVKRESEKVQRESEKAKKAEEKKQAAELREQNKEKQLALKAEKQKKRCQHWANKINFLQKKLRQPQNPKTIQKIKSDIEYIKLMQQRYCNECQS